LPEISCARDLKLQNEVLIEVLNEVLIDNLVYRIIEEFNRNPARVFGRPLH